MKKLLVLLMVGLLSVVAFADIQTGYDPDDGGDKLRFMDSNELEFGSSQDVVFNFNGTSFEMESVAAATPWLIGGAAKVFNATMHGSFTMGADDTGYDFKAFGATATKYFMWDESADAVVLVGDFGMTGDLAVTGALSATTFTGLVIGTDVQAYDADLTTYAGITPSANVQTLLGSADFAAFVTSLSLTIGTNTQAWDADLDTYAGITPSANVQTLLGAADFATFVTSLSLTIGTNTQAYDADLTTYAGITPSANVQTFLGYADFAAMVAGLSLTIGTDTQAYDADLDTYATITPSAAAQIAFVATDSFVLNQRHRVTVAEINAGHEILPAIAGKSYRIIECLAIAYGGAVGTTTTVDLLGTQAAGSVKLVAYAQAGLTQSAVLVSGGTNAAVTADGASYAACDANTAVTVGKTGGDADTATGVDFILTYVIE